MLAIQSSFHNEHIQSQHSFLSDDLSELYSDKKLVTSYKLLSKNNSDGLVSSWDTFFKSQAQTNTSRAIDNVEQELFIKASFEEELLSILNNTFIEVGEVSSADYLIEEYIGKFSNTKYWLGDIATKFTKNTPILSKLLLLVSRLSPSQMGEMGHLIAMASMNNTDLEIRENAIRILETYSDQRSLEMLEASRADDVEWIETYKSAIIKRIKKKSI